MTLGTIEVLHLDESPSDRALVREAIERERGVFRVTGASSRRELEDQVGRGAFDVVLTDFDSAGFEGLKVMDAIRVRRIDLPVVIVTAKGSEELAAEAMKRGAADYVVKMPRQLARLPGTILAVIEKARAIAERREAEDSLRRSERRLRGLLDGLGPSIFAALLGADGTVVDVNKPVLDVAGLALDQLVGQPIWLTEPWSHELAVQTRVKEAVARASAGEASHYDVELRVRDGATIVIDFCLQPVRDDAGSIVNLVASAVDITERKRIERKLSASEERLREIAERVNEAFWISDPRAGTMLYVSPGYEIIWQRSCASLYAAPRDWLEAVHPEDRTRAAASAAAATVAGTYDEEYRIVRRDGSMRWVHARAFPVHDASGALVHVVGVAQDVTEQLQLEERLRQSQKMEAIGQLAGGVAHDFNNILTVIGSNIDLVLADLAPDDPKLEIIEELREAAARASVLTRQLLAFSRKQLLTPRVLNVNRVVEEMKDMVQRLIGENIALVYRLAVGLDRVKVDAGQLQQVILNLVVNARDAMPDGGTTTIETFNADRGPDKDGKEEVGPRVCLVVSDIGLGMSEETRRHLFEPFFTTKESGTGLGLSTVYGIVRQSGGVVRVESMAGHGSRFEIWLPSTLEREEESVEAPGAPPRARGGETVLIVEDEIQLRRIAERVLRGAGYAVIAAGSAENALALVESHEGPIDLMVTDVILPGASGRHLADHLVARRPQSRVLYCSGYSDDMIVRHGVLNHRAHFLPKPYGTGDLLRRVREVLDAPR